MKTLGKRRIFIIAPLILILIGTTALATARDDVRYVISEILRRPDVSYMPQKQEFGRDTLRLYSIEELAEDERVEFNQELMLVNEQYPLSEGYSPALSNLLGDEILMNTAVSDAYGGLASAIDKNCRQKLCILSAYRSAEQQREVAAEEGEKAADINASEHRTGLALDVCVKYFAGEGFIKSAAGIFTQNHCYEYGFIIRYPLFQKAKTGFDYEPWHLRYVGTPHSEIIYKSKLTLEKYISSFEIGAFYFFEDYIITRQPEDKILLPQFSRASVSPDNTGYYIFTLNSK